MKILDVLRRLEWIDGRCNICGAEEKAGEHYQDCELTTLMIVVKLLGRAFGEGGE